MGGTNLKMAVYYKFKSARDNCYHSIAIDRPVISLGLLIKQIWKSKIIHEWEESKRLRRDDVLVVTNAQTNVAYIDENALILDQTLVIIRRLPGPPLTAIAVTDSGKPKVEDEVEYGTEQVADEPDFDDFGPDLFEAGKVMVSFLGTPDNSDGDGKKEEAVIDAAPVLFGWKDEDIGRVETIPKQGYICHRCNVSGHFIQYCPTNGDPYYNSKTVKPTTGAPKSMLMAASEAAFDKEMEGVLPLSRRSVGDLPPELHCRLCKQVMKYAVIVRKCCLESFCDGCIRNYLTSSYNSSSGCVCVCGATHILADDLIPNLTVRATINRMLEYSGGNSCSSGNNAGSSSNSFQVQDMLAKIPSPSSSAAKTEETNVKPVIVVAPQRVSNPKVKATKVATDDVSSTSSKETTVKSQEGQVLVEEEEVQQRAGKKRKMKKLGADNYMMPMDPTTAYNPCWNWMQQGYMTLHHMGNYMISNAGEYELSEDQRHVKGKRLRYEASPSAAAVGC